MSAGSQPDSDGPNKFSDATDGELAPSASEPSAEPAFLNDIISETLDGAPSEALAPRELDVLLQVARRHRNRPLELEPVVVDLVASLVKIRFPSSAVHTDHEEMSQAIAASLFHSPASERKLRAFWSKLIEKAQ